MTATDQARDREYVLLVNKLYSKIKQMEEEHKHVCNAHEARTRECKAVDVGRRAQLRYSESQVLSLRSAKDSAMAEVRAWTEHARAEIAEI